MMIVRKSPFTGKFHKKELNVTPSQFDAWERGVHIQKAFPDITDDDREFIKTGITGEEFDSMMGGE
jgi:hypothetical protein